MSTELVNFSERIGGYAFAFFMRGYVYDTSIPGFIASSEAILFF